MSKIRNIEQLREFALQTLEDLSTNTIELSEAHARGKLVENVILTVKAQMEYNKITKIENPIPFMIVDGTQSRMIEGETIKRLYHQKNKY